jgi:hypothetical protein
MQNITNFSDVNSFVAKFEDHKQTLSEREQTIKWLQVHNYPALGSDLQTAAPQSCLKNDGFRRRSGAASLGGAR